MSDPKHELDGCAPKSGAEICLASIQDKLALLSSDTLNYGRVCIYKVPEKHRNKNPEAYIPRLVSIGLIHYGENQVQTMEEYKLKYLSNFLQTFRVDLKELVEYVDGEEKLVCCCYEDVYVRYVSENRSKVAYDEDSNYARYVSGNKPKVPSEVILLDGIFVLELFLKNHFLELRENGDMVFDNSWISNEILHDLLLFENQLPFKFLYNLYEKFVFNGMGKWLGDDSFHPPSFDELTHKYFKDVGNTGKLPLRENARDARHFVEFLSLMHDPYEKESTIVDIEENGESKSYSVKCQTPTEFTKCAILERFFTKCPIFLKPYEKLSIGVQNKGKLESKSNSTKCPTTSELQAAGVQFVKGTTNCLLNVHFDFKAGVLKIPPLTVNDSTETFLRNLIAFEQSGCYTKYTTSLVILLDNLIDTPRDVEILVNHGILVNELGSSKQVADLFNSIYKEFLPNPNEFYFVKECYELKAYSRDWWHMAIAAVTGWVVMLKRDYFSSPWAVISVIAAFIVLGLTAIQTVYAIKGAK